MLEEVDDVDEIKEESESRVFHSSAASGTADTLAFRASSQNVDRTVVGHQVGEGGWSNQGDVLRHEHAVEGLNGRVEDEMGVLQLELDQGVSRYLPADGVSIHIGVDSNHDAGIHCHAEDS